MIHESTKQYNIIDLVLIFYAGLADEVRNQNMKESLTKISEKYDTEAIESLVSALKDSL